MPNPLARVQNTSKKPPERPEALTPEPEHYAGDNNPYRGTESHGVPATNKPSPTQGDWDTREGRTYLPADAEYEPIPVRIVQEHGNEFRRFRPHAMTTNASNTFRFIARNMNRSSVFIDNPDAALSFWIGGPGLTPGISAFEVKAGKSITLATTDEIWVIGSAIAPAVQNVQAIEYYVVED